MVLSKQHKLNLIRDILNSHHLDGAASAREYEQLHRSTESLMSEMADEPLNGTLEAIHQYSRQGMQLKAYDTHLSDNKENFQSWLNQLQ
ncbi:YtzH-like family protein [Scopulibacillus cellulosilyticus]|uniref:YtzH-like family protein n=1 Tax=Scopulibacillus cellulosilyticus TaxID=2665665 RepID=A0ABW2Q282_9BACL